jgi:hypothetical protein
VKIRSFITASPGNILIQSDLSQAESWVVAYCARELNMKQSLQFSDIHYDTAVVFYDRPRESISKLERYTAKRCNHAFAYRMTAPRFMQVYNKDAVDMGITQMAIKTANMFRDMWLKRYDLQSWWAEIEETLSVTRTITTPYGRVRTFFAQWGTELFKEATAHIPQSTVADHFGGMVQDQLGIEGGLKCIWRDWHDKCMIINQSHDSCIVDIHPSMRDDYIESAIKYLKRPLVINGETFTIPVSVEIGTRWGELEEIKI